MRSFLGAIVTKPSTQLIRKMLALSILGSLSYIAIKVTVRSIEAWIIKNPQYSNVHEFLILQQYYVCLLNANF